MGSNHLNRCKEQEDGLPVSPGQDVQGRAPGCGRSIADVRERPQLHGGEHARSFLHPVDPQCPAKPWSPSRSNSPRAASAVALNRNAPDEGIIGTQPAGGKEIAARIWRHQPLIGVCDDRDDGLASMKFGGVGHSPLAADQMPLVGRRAAPWSAGRWPSGGIPPERDGLPWAAGGTVRPVVDGYADGR